MSSCIPSLRCRSHRAAFVAALGLSSAALAAAPRGAQGAEQAEKQAAQVAAKPTASAAAKPTASAAAKPAASAALKPAAQAAPSAAQRERARQLVLEGDGFYERRELEQALDRYAQAYQLVPVPTVGIEVVKAQTALGKLIEAQATAQEVASAPRQRGEPAVFEDARVRATQANLRLTGMIPSLWLEVSPPGVVFEVEIDGVTPSGPPPYRLNPGAHQVRVRASGYQTRLLGITLREAERLNRRAELVAEGSAGSLAAAAASSTAAAPAAAVTPAPAQPTDSAPAAAQGSSLRSLGWVSLGVAAVAAGAGAYAGLRAFSSKPDCPNDTCAPSQQSDIDDSLRMGTIANVSVGVAVVTGALGIWALASGGAEGERNASLGELPVSVGLGKLREIRVSGRF